MHIFSTFHSTIPPNWLNYRLHSTAATSFGSLSLIASLHAFPSLYFFHSSFCCLCAQFSLPSFICFFSALLTFRQKTHTKHGANSANLPINNPKNNVAIESVFVLLQIEYLRLKPILIACCSPTNQYFSFPFKILMYAIESKSLDWCVERETTSTIVNSRWEWDGLMSCSSYRCLAVALILKLRCFGKLLRLFLCVPFDFLVSCSVGGMGVLAVNCSRRIQCIGHPIHILSIHCSNGKSINSRQITIQELKERPMKMTTTTAITASASNWLRQWFCTLKMKMLASATTDVCFHRNH